MNATRRATRILQRGVNQSKLFAQNLPDLAPVLNKLMQLKRVTKYLMTVDGRPSGGAPSSCAILQQKYSNSNAILITFRSF